MLHGGRPDDGKKKMRKRKRERCWKRERAAIRKVSSITRDTEGKRLLVCFAGRKRSRSIKNTRRTFQDQVLPNSAATLRRSDDEFLRDSRGYPRRRLIFFRKLDFVRNTHPKPERPSPSLNPSLIDFLQIGRIGRLSRFPI